MSTAGIHRLQLFAHRSKHFLTYHFARSLVSLQCQKIRDESHAYPFNLFLTVSRRHWYQKSETSASHCLDFLKTFDAEMVPVLCSGTVLSQKISYTLGYYWLMAIYTKQFP